MARWFWMLGGLVIWTVHLMGVYAIASLADVVSRADDPGWRMIGLAFSAVCLLAASVFTIAAIRRARQVGGSDVAFGDQLALLGGGLAAVAIAWQALPTVTGY
jgi:hypothetical protein